MDLRVILIIDKNIPDRLFLYKLLSETYTIIQSDSAKDGLLELQKNAAKISAIILDLDLSDISSFDVLKTIHANEEFANIPIIVSSNTNSEQSEIEALSLGAVDFITKPYNEQIVKHRIANNISMSESSVIVNSVIKDELTGLYNKQYFMRQARTILDSPKEKKYDLICIDIERFKLVNDILGTSLCDKLLVHIGQVIKTYAGEKSLCARFSGDIFFVLLAHAIDYTPEVAETVTAKINSYPEIQNINIRLKLYYGIYSIHDFSIPVNLMCDRAQLAVDGIKGKYDTSFAFYDDSIRKKMILNQRITNTMESALAQGEFQVYYQPKYKLSDETISGAEALVRWINPEMGYMSPEYFIPLFEKNGFITQLDMFVWETVCKNMHGWIEAGHDPVAVSVNVSRADIYNPKITDIIVGIIQKYQIPPRYIHLEITESAYTESPEQIIKAIHELREHGFTIEMDDFGSGYSSLNMLSEMPIDILKLDMGFVHNEMKHASGREILSFIISLAKWLDLAVVAEGVETKEQILMLRSMECNYVQGFYFAKPLPQNEFEALLLKTTVSEMSSKSSISVTTVEELIPDGAKESNGIMFIVDDIEANRVVIEQTFKNEFNIEQASNGFEAWNYLKEHYQEIGIVMLDLLMPVMDGFQLLEKIRTDKCTWNIPVIVTSQGDENSEKRVLSMSADDFVSKPYNPEILRHRVRNVVAHSKIQRLEKERNEIQTLLEKERQNNTDCLSGLPTRYFIESAVNDFFASESKDNPKKIAAFIMMDIDNFKDINDSLGHIKGDETIQKVAHILKEIFVDDKNIFCRMGGDEFSVFIPSELSSDKLNDLLTSLCTKMQFCVGKIKISASIGVSVSPDHGIDYQTLYTNADTALITAKRCGKNQYQFYNKNMVLTSPILFRNLDWLLDKFNEGVHVCDAETYEIFYMNEVACNLAGKTKQESIGKKCYEVLWNKTSRCEFCTDLYCCSSDFTESQIEAQGVWSNYKMKSKLVDWGDRKARIQYLENNTKTSQLVNKLDFITKNFRQLINKKHDAELHYSYDHDNTISFVSDSLLEMLGTTRDEFIKKYSNNFNNIISKNDKARILCEINDQIKVSNSYFCDYHIEKKDSSLCHVFTNGQLTTDEEGRKWVHVTLVNL